ncbi:replicative DNA helicase [Synoicihabitans lomoniglobus]|uniref:Replicative DNA helicase n=1 Tax=Synoicihabitans lomoniglobus TaxID=2909285 RepID=A0AAF0I3N5_9BACT|nr:replicative DNA helicase [Opitutaceae bacterium LMO-M01]WED66030.1 replicative DNA helicase [Opitutaceae bacterium LMO-M01]
MDQAPPEFRSKNRRRPERNGEDSDVPTLGRQPPHSIDAEEYLLSCCLLDGSDSIAKCLEKKLPPAAFFFPANRIIYEKLLELYQKSPPVAIEVLAEELKTTGQLDEIGGVPYLMQVSSRIPTTAQTDYFLERVRELYLLRQLIKVGTSTVEQCFSFQGGLEEFVDKVEQDIFQVTQDRVSDAAKSMKETAKEAWVVIDKMMHHKGEITGVSSGFKELDAMTYGFQAAEMIVLAARPSMGKTSLALNMAESAALPKRGEPAGVLLFSLEMSAAQLGMRMLCSRGRVNMKKLREGFVRPGGDEYRDLVQAADELSKAPIFIDDSSQLTIMELRAKARRLATRQKLGFVVVDYLQLLSATDPKTPREQQVAEISRGLKSLAKELAVPVLVLSQLNRAAEKENRTPKLSDLRESGSIEQDADVVLMLARPRDADEKFQVAADSAELIVAKQRNGPVGDLKLTFLRDITRFENYTP